MAETYTGMSREEIMAEIVEEQVHQPIAVLHAEFLSQLASGAIEARFDLAAARRFFVGTDVNEALFMFDEDIRWRRAVLRILLSLAYLFASAHLALAVFIWSWYSLLVIPAVLFVFFLQLSQATKRTGIGWAILQTLTCTGVGYAVRSSGVMPVLWVLMFPLPFLFSRLVYRTGARYFAEVTFRNPKVWVVSVGRAMHIRKIRGDS